MDLAVPQDFKELQLAAAKYDAISVALEEELSMAAKDFQRVWSFTSRNLYFAANPSETSKCDASAITDMNAVQTVALVVAKESSPSKNQRKLTYELINLVFQLNDQLERQQSRDRQLLEERTNMENKYIQMLRNSKEKMKQTSKMAIRRQAAFEAESNKKLQELQQQRRSLMKRLNAAELEARKYKHRSKLLQQRVEHLEEQVNYAMKAIDNFELRKDLEDEKCDSESLNEP